jgi:hypothetical protein
LGDLLIDSKEDHPKMTTSKLEFDPSRLTALDAKRRQSQALQRAANDQLAELRELKNDERRMADLLFRKSLDGDNDARKAAEAQAEQHQEEAAKLTRQMAEVEAEMSAHSSAAGRANTLFRRALEFAVAEGLTVPDALEAEAEQVRLKGVI